MTLTAHNRTFAIGGVSCSADTFVVNQSFVFRINISGKNRQSHFANQAGNSNAFA